MTDADIVREWIGGCLALHGFREDCPACVAYRDAMDALRRAEAAEAERNEALARLRVVGDDYEAANLRAGLLTLRKLGLDTGDWLGQIEQRIPSTDQVPNRSVESQVAQIAAFAAYRETHDALTARAVAAEARVTELETALLAWWEPQRHSGRCYCRACTLTRAALAAPTKEDTGEGEGICEACGGAGGAYRGWHDDGAPMRTCADCSLAKEDTDE